MNEKKWLLIAVVVILLIAGSAALIREINLWKYDNQIAFNETDYQTRKQVEDQCRAMIASYKSDRDVYMKYKDSTDTGKANMAEQSWTRANRISNTYNEYILKNKHVWKNNIPADIMESLDTLTLD